MSDLNQERDQKMTSLLENLSRQEEGDSVDFRFFDYPMHYFAAIQVKNQANVARLLAAVSLSPIEWRVLATVRERKNQTVNDIAAVTAFDRFKVSRCVLTLTDRGFLRQNKAANDRRQVRTELTPEGMKKFSQALVIIKRVYLNNLDGVSEEEFNILMRLMRRIKDNVNRSELF